MERNTDLFVGCLMAADHQYLNPLILSVIMCPRAVQTLRNHFPETFFMAQSAYSVGCVTQND